MMKLLKLFSGTKSVGKVARDKGYSVISLDWKDADINSDILEWNFKDYKVGYFDFIYLRLYVRDIALRKRQE